MERKLDGGGEAAHQTPSTPQSEENVYAGVYHVLLLGMVISTAFYALGMVRALLQPQYIPLRTAWIRQHYHWLTVLRGFETFDPTVLMMTATVILILTPISRVLVSIHAFYVDHDHKYVVVTSIVFLVIVLTMVLGWLGLK